MRLEIDIPGDDVRAIDELAALAGTTRDRVIHWALAAYLRLDERGRAMAAHPAGRDRKRQSA